MFASVHRSRMRTSQAAQPVGGVLFRRLAIFLSFVIGLSAIGDLSGGHHGWLHSDEGIAVVDGGAQPSEPLKDRKDTQSHVEACSTVGGCSFLLVGGAAAYRLAPRTSEAFPSLDTALRGETLSPEIAPPKPLLNT